MRRRQSVRRGAWYMGGRRKRRTQTGGPLTDGALAAPNIRDSRRCCYKKIIWR